MQSEHMGNRHFAPSCFARRPWLIVFNLVRCHVRSTIALLTLMVTMSSWACTVPPSHLSHSNHQLVQSTDVIVLARAESFAGSESDKLATFRFETVRGLKGEAPKTFTLAGFHADREQAPGDFGKHLSPRFWAFADGNSIQPGNCSAYGLFKPGETYLVFLRKQPHLRAYENVIAPDDLWLQVIELLIKTDKAGAP